MGRRRPVPAAEPKKRSRYAVIGGIVLAIVVVAILSFAIARLSPPSTSLPSVRFRMRQPEGIVLGDVPRMALSPDGRYLYYGKGGATPGIWRLALNAPETTEEQVIDRPSGSMWKAAGSCWSTCGCCAPNVASQCCGRRT